MPMPHRTKSATLATAGDWIFNYMIVQITLVAILNIGWKTYIIFFVLKVAFAILIFFILLERSGRTLEEIDLLYVGYNDRLIVVDKRLVLQREFRSEMNRADELESLDLSSRPSDVGKVMEPHEKVIGQNKEMTAS